MNVPKDKVYLVQGQRQIEGAEGLNGSIEQIIVVAQGSDAVSEILADSAPDFRMIGLATLKDYEATAAKIKAALGGKTKEWPVLIAPGMTR